MSKGLFYHLSHQLSWDINSITDLKKMSALLDSAISEGLNKDGAVKSICINNIFLGIVEPDMQNLMEEKLCFSYKEEILAMTESNLKDLANRGYGPAADEVRKLQCKFLLQDKMNSLFDPSSSSSGRRKK